MGAYGLWKEPKEPFKKFFTRELGGENEHFKITVLDCAVVNMRTAYLAISRLDKGTNKNVVYAEVILLYYKRNDPDENLIYRPMDEFDGPNEAECPERILNRLSPLGDFSDILSEQRIEWAKRWREDCKARIEANKEAKKREIGIGFTFTYGGRTYTITHERNKQSWRLNGYYKMGKARLRKCLANGQAVEVKCT